jgi:hypothetical protein
MFLKKTRLLVILTFIFGWLSLSISSISYAFDKSRVFATGILISGVGMKFYEVNLNKSANQAYDEYLHTARQSELKQHLDTYENKRSQSLLVSRISSGMAAFALLYSIFDEIAQSTNGIDGKLGRRDRREKDLLTFRLPHFPSSRLSHLKLDTYPRKVLIVATKEF